MRSLAFTAIALVLALPSGPAAAQYDRSFADVSADIFTCVKETSADREGTVYAESEPNQGTATTRSTLWTVVMEYAYSPVTLDLQYRLVRKTWVVPAGAVWSGITDMIAECRGNAP